MSRRWAILVILTVVTIALLSGWEIYNIFTDEKDVQEYSNYVEPIDSELDTEFLKNVYELENKILVEEKEIQPKN